MFVLISAGIINTIVTGTIHTTTMNVRSQVVHLGLYSSPIVSIVGEEKEERLIIAN